MTTCEATELVTMKSGLAVSRDALALLWRLEDGGYVVQLDDDRLQVGPSSRVTDEDDQAIRKYRDELIMLVQMCEEVTA